MLLSLPPNYTLYTPTGFPWRRHKNHFFLGRRPSSLQVLEIWELGDGCLDVAAEHVLQLSRQPGDMFVPFPDFLYQRLHVPLFPVVPLVVDAGEDAEILGVVKHPHDQQMAA